MASLDLTSLMWEDILFPHVFPYLSTKDQFRLRGTSKAFKKLVDCYFRQMRKCDLIEYSGVFTPVAFSVLIEQCCELRVLYIRNLYWLTDDMLKQIFLNNKLLTHLDLSFCNNITSAAFQPVILHQKQLTYLKLESCYWLTSGCLEALALHHCNLEVLSLASCSIPDVQAITILLQRSINLKELNLSGLHCVSDSTMEVIAHCNRKLKLLNVNGCHLVSSYGAMMVGEYCAELEFMFLTGCGITVNAIGHLRKKVPFLCFDNRAFVTRGDPYSFMLRIPV